MSVAGRILVVDDDEGIRESIETALLSDGYEVRLAEDGAAALYLFREWKPDVILLDMKMPGMDGWTFATLYRQHPAPRPPVIVLTAAPDAAGWAQEIGADEVLPKPFDLYDLLDVIGRYASAS